MRVSHLFSDSEPNLKLFCNYPESTQLNTNNVLFTKAKGLVVDNNVSNNLNFSEVENVSNKEIDIFNISSVNIVETKPKGLMVDNLKIPISSGLCNDIRDRAQNIAFGDFNGLSDLNNLDSQMRCSYFNDDTTVNLSDDPIYNRKSKLITKGQDPDIWCGPGKYQSYCSPVLTSLDNESFKYIGNLANNGWATNQRSGLERVLEGSREEILGKKEKPSGWNWPWTKPTPAPPERPLHEGMGGIYCLPPLDDLCPTAGHWVETAQGTFEIGDLVYNNNNYYQIAEMTGPHAELAGGYTTYILNITDDPYFTEILAKNNWLAQTVIFYDNENNPITDGLLNIDDETAMAMGLANPPTPLPGNNDGQTPAPGDTTVIAPDEDAYGGCYSVGLTRESQFSELGNLLKKLNLEALRLNDLIADGRSVDNTKLLNMQQLMRQIEHILNFCNASQTDLTSNDVIKYISEAREFAASIGEVSIGSVLKVLESFEKEYPEFTIKVSGENGMVAYVNGPDG